MSAARGTAHLGQAGGPASMSGGDLDTVNRTRDLRARVDTVASVLTRVALDVEQLTSDEAAALVRTLDRIDLDVRWCTR